MVLNIDPPFVSFPIEPHESNSLYLLRNTAHRSPTGVRTGHNLAGCTV